MEELMNVSDIEFAEQPALIDKKVADEINSAIVPIRRVEPEDVYVRALFVTSNRLNSQGGRFEREGIEELCRLIPGAPVLVGHDKGKLPIARCFKARKVERHGAVWSKAWFYWLKKTTGADDLLKNIDGGIYTECSLGFSFESPECSVCGGDIRRCSHVPGRLYRGASGSKDICHYVYRGIKSVNEISLVYRGAVPGTAVVEQSNETSSESNDSWPVYGGGRLIRDAENIGRLADGAVIHPVYHGVPLRLMRFDDRFEVAVPDPWSRLELVRRLPNLLDAVFGGGRCSIDGVIVHYRGKSRTPVCQMERILSGDSEAKGRWRVKLFINEELSGMIEESDLGRLSKQGVDFILSRQVFDGNEIDRMETTAPKEGVAVYYADELIVHRNCPRFLIRVTHVTKTRSGKYCYDLALFDDGHSAAACTTYETKVKADIGDTLFVEAEPTSQNGRLSLSKIKVIDNLRNYFEADRLQVCHLSDEIDSCGFKLSEFGKTGVILETPTGLSHMPKLIVPFFSIKQLDSGKTMVGYPCDEEVTGATLLDSGEASVLNSTEDGCRVSFDGRSLKGEIVLRAAILKNERVVLLYRTK